MLTQLPKSAIGQPLPVMALTNGKGGNLAIGSSSASIPLGQDANAATGLVIQLQPTVACFVAVGTSGVVAAVPAAGAFANGHFLAAGVCYTFFVPQNQTHIAAIQASAAGTLYISVLSGDGA